MVNPLQAFVEKYAGADFGPRLKRSVAGIAEDFWKDPVCEYPVLEIKLLGRSLKIPNLLKPVAAQASGKPAPAAPAAAKKASSARWHAMPGEVSEKMWGEGQLLPAGDALMEMMTKPAGLTKNMAVLDLSAGLGGPARKLIAQVAQVKALELSPVFAARATELSSLAGRAKNIPVSAYALADFTMPSIYDVAVAREVVCQAADKQKFLSAVAAGVKLHGSFVFTDYIVDPENRKQPAILSWQAQEKNMMPAGLIEMAELLAKAGFEMRVNEDRTAFYKGEILAGLKRLAVFLASSPRPDAETKKEILHEVEVWIRRMGAIGQGLKLYRFHAIRT